MMDCHHYDLICDDIDPVDNTVRKSVQAASSVLRIECLPAARMLQNAVDRATEIREEFHAKPRPRQLVILECFAKV